MPHYVWFCLELNPGAAFLLALKLVLQSSIRFPLAENNLTRAAARQPHLPHFEFILKPPCSRNNVVGMLQGAMVESFDLFPMFGLVTNQAVGQLSVFLAGARNNAQRMMVGIVLFPHDIRVNVPIPFKATANNHGATLCTATHPASGFSEVRCSPHIHLVTAQRVSDVSRASALRKPGAPPELPPIPFPQHHLFPTPPCWTGRRGMV